MRRRQFIALSAFTLVLPISGHAQKAARLPRIGVLHPGPNKTASLTSPAWTALEQALRGEGFIDGQTCTFEHRYSDLPSMRSVAAELVSINVDVIVVRGPGPMQAAREATTKIPIVMAASSVDPVKEGLIASYARPGGNITGVTYSVSAERFEKQLQILKEAASSISRLGVLWDVGIEVYNDNWALAIERASAKLSLEVAGPYVAQKVGELEDAFLALKRDRADAVLVCAAGMIYTNQARVAELAIRNGLPIIGAFKELPRGGGLMSYGPDPEAINRRVATFVARILRGGSAAELPVENPDTYELTINLKTARALGLTIPPTLLARADEVIE